MEKEFRFWEKETRSILYTTEEVQLCADGKIGRWENTGHCETCRSFEFVDKSDEYIALQYSGLKDKDGNKIFEGDIIKLEQNWKKMIGVCGGDGSDVRENCLVGLKRGSFMIGRRAHGEAALMDTYLWLVSGHGVVVGNIYENEDILADPLTESVVF